MSMTCSPLWDVAIKSLLFLEKLDFDNESCLIIYLYENYLQIIKNSTESFEDFLFNAENDRLSDLKETIKSISNTSQAHKELSIYAKSMMIDMNLEIL